MATSGLPRIDNMMAGLSVLSAGGVAITIAISACSLPIAVATGAAAMLGLARQEFQLTPKNGLLLICFLVGLAGVAGWFAYVLAP